MFNLLKARNLKDNSNCDDNNIKLLFIRDIKKPKTIAANNKSIGNKLLLVPTKFAYKSILQN